MGRGNTLAHCESSSFYDEEGSEERLGGRELRDDGAHGKCTAFINRKKISHQSAGAMHEEEEVHVHVRRRTKLTTNPK